MNDEDESQNLNIPTRLYIDQKIHHLEDKINLRLEANKIAAAKNEVTLNERLDHMNEFRETMKDQAAHFVTETELDLKLRSVTTELRSLCAAIALLVLGSFILHYLVPVRI